MGDLPKSPDCGTNHEKNNHQVKAHSLEKQLWKCVQSAGLLSNDAQRLYKEACSCYEKLVLCELDFSEIQDVEYSLWKLHYKHIDEFRRRIRQKAANARSPRPPKPPNGANGRQSSTNHVDGFKLFLSESTKFYQDMLLKIRRHYGFLEENCGLGIKSEAKVRKCQFLCHRFLICIGDLARYKEQHENHDVRNRNWSVAATYYMKASVIWPDGGNSQNQLALLATYVGDEFLALFHCIRSLAVKEPFPDAWNNLMLLFEKNQSAFLHSISNEACFNFSNPSERTNQLKESEKNCSRKTELWSLFVRLTSFFLTKCSSKDFPCIFASTMAELEALMELDDTKLRASLESYQHIGSARSGPFKALHIVSVLIFIVEHLTQGLKQTDIEAESAIQRLESVQLSLVMTFICMGRLIDRCLEPGPLDICPLLPGLLVFMEWLAGMIDETEAHCEDENVFNAMCYFYDSVVDLLNLITRSSVRTRSARVTALWEDFELQGFVPLANAHSLLDFSHHIENRKNVENGKDCRARRIISAAVRIAKRTGSSRKWILYTESDRSFSTVKSDVRVGTVKLEALASEPEAAIATREPGHLSCGASEKLKPGLEKIDEETMPSEYSSHVVDEEEVILFKPPIVRHNSAPVQICADNDSSTSESSHDHQHLTADECLRRSKSLLVMENQVKTVSTASESQSKAAPSSTTENLDAPKLNPMFSNFNTNKLFRQPETPKELSSSHPFAEAPVARGPPSLNAWVLEQGSSSNDQMKDLNNISKHHLRPIEEIPSKSLSSLSVNTSADSVISSSYFSPASPRYSRPPPALSPPLMPSSAPWLSNEYNSVQLADEDDYPGTPKGRAFYDRITNYRTPLSTNAPVLTNKHPPLSGMLSSSEWLRQYREKQGLKQPQANGNKFPPRSYMPANPYITSADTSSTMDLFDRWGNPVVSVPMTNIGLPSLYSGIVLPSGAHRGIDDQLRDKLSQNYRNNPNPYDHLSEATDEPGPLLQYLKEVDLWKMQQKQHSRGPPAYTGT